MKNIICFLEYNKQDEKTKISPIGNFVGVDGRKYYLDPEVIINNTKSTGCDLMLDKDHQDAEAMGWFDINSLEIRTDGIYAKLELNPLGKEFVENKIYRYLSPAYTIGGSNGDTKIIERIVSVGLVNRPNLLFHSLNNQNDASLELKKQIELLQKENKELKAKIEQLQKQIEEEQNNSITKRVEEAIIRGEMLPSRKDIALTLKNAALDSYMEVCKQEAKLILQTKSPNIAEPNKQEEIDARIKEQLGL